MQHAHMSLVALLAALILLLQGGPVWAEEYRNPNQQGPDEKNYQQRVSCNNAGPMNRYLESLEKRAQTLEDEIEKIKSQIAEAVKRQQEAQKRLDDAIRRRNRQEESLARSALERGKTKRE